MAASYAAGAVKGVISADDDSTNNSLTVVFDNEKTTIEKISEGLKKDNFSADGAPEFLEMSK